MITAVTQRLHRHTGDAYLPDHCIHGVLLLSQQGNEWLDQDRIVLQRFSITRHVLKLFLRYEPQMLHVGKVQHEGGAQRINPLNPDISLLTLQIVHIHTCTDLIGRTGSVYRLQILGIPELNPQIPSYLNEQIHRTASAMENRACAKELGKLGDHPVCSRLLAACECTHLLCYTVCFQKGIHASNTPACAVQNPFQQFARSAYPAAIIFQFQKEVLVRQPFGHMLTFDLKFQHPACADISRL